MTINSEVDARGLTCPEPVMMLHAAIRDLMTGETVKMIATDLSTKKDVANFCEFLGHTLLSAEENGEELIFVVKKG